jgi:TP901 family phage tail tape measure protein
MAQVTKRVASVFVDDKQAAATLKRLQTEAQTLQKRLEQVPHGSKEFKQIEQRLVQVQRNMRALNNDVAKSESLFGKMGKSLGGLGKMFVGFFAAGKILSVFNDAGRIIQDFEKAQSGLAAVLGKNRSEIGELTKDAKLYGSTTAFTASQVSELQTELAKLGFTERQIRSSTGAVLELAAASNTDLGNAATIAASTVRAFGLDAEDTQRVVDVMAASFSKSSLDIQKFSVAMSSVAPVAKTFGFSVEDTTALVAQLSDAGFDASSSGTALRNILLNLADSNGALAQKLGGSVKSFDELIPALRQLRADGVSLNETLELTDKRSVAAFNRFLDTADGALELRDGLNEAEGAAKRMAAEQLNNLRGDKLILQSAWEGFVLSIEDGSGVISKAMRGITRMLTETLEAFTQMNDRSAAVENFTEQVKNLMSAEDQRRIKLGSNEAQRILDGYRLQTDALKDLGNTVEDIGMIEARRSIMLRKLNSADGAQLTAKGRLEAAALKASLAIIDQELEKRQALTEAKKNELSAEENTGEKVRAALAKAREEMMKERRTGIQKELDDVNQKYDALRAIALENEESIAAVEKQRQEALAAVRAKHNQKQVDQFRTLNTELERIRDEQRIAAMSKEDGEIERIRVRYTKLEEQAKGHAGRLAEIAELRDAEIDAKRAENEEKRKAAIALFNEELEKSRLNQVQRELDLLRTRHERELEMAQANGEDIKELLALQQEDRQPLIEEQRQAELEALDAHYEAMRLRAEELLLDEDEIERRRTAALMTLRRQHAEEDVALAQETDKRVLDSLKQRADAERQVISSIQEITRDLFTAAGADADEMADFQKAMTLFTIGMDTAQAISALTAMSEANPANAVTGGVAGIAQFIAGFARITANIAQATQVLSSKPKPAPPAFAVGGGTGDAIGSWYTAPTSTGRNISTGGKVNTATWGLFGEKGPEWVGPNWMYQHPTLEPVFQHLEYIRTTGRVPAFEQGGTTGMSTSASAAMPGASSNEQSSAVLMQLAITVGQLQAQLQAGITATISNDLLVENSDRINTIEDQANIRR